MCARWRLTVVAGLLVAPFFPASNVLFYVGTFIGERLLYFPSVGYCVLLADLLGQAWQGRQRGAAEVPQEQQGSQPQVEQQPEQGAGGSSAGSSGSSAQVSGMPARLARALLVLLVLAALVLGAGRTWLRNEDWATEDALFLAAEKVGAIGGRLQVEAATGMSMKVQVAMHICLLLHQDSASTCTTCQAAAARVASVCDCGAEHLGAQHGPTGHRYRAGASLPGPGTSGPGTSGTAHTIHARTLPPAPTHP